MAEQVDQMNTNPPPTPPGETMKTNVTKEVIVWADGCYDVGHFGHANSLRQGRALGTRLVVGVHSDAEIMKHKGPPLFRETERYAMIAAMRWVDEVVEDAPYVTTLETLDQHACAFCTHGNDITTDANGVDTYKLVKDAGRYREVERTRGVSTTDIINRMLRMGHGSPTGVPDLNQNLSPYTGGKSPFILTRQKLIEFGGSKDVTKCERVVLVCGCFDVFHPGHIDFLKEASLQGDYLLVGVHDDTIVKSYMGDDYPVMNLNERVMCLLGCKYVDDVILGVPLDLTPDIIDEFKVKTIVKAHERWPMTTLDSQADPWLDIIYLTNFDPDMMTKEVVARVHSRRAEFEARNAKKEQRESELLNRPDPTEA